MPMPKGTFAHQRRLTDSPMRTRSMHFTRSLTVDSGRHSDGRNKLEKSHLLRWQLSVTDLLRHSADCSKNLFPLIDQQKYRSNAPQSIYDPDIGDTTVEIDQYFGDSRKGHFNRMSKMVRGSSATKGPKDASKQTERKTQPDNVFKVDGAKDRANSCRTHADDQHRTKQSVEKESEETDIVSGKPSSNCFSLRCKISGVDILLQCNLTYLAESKQLEFHIARGSISDDANRCEKKLFAKICLLPGVIQKQQVKIEPVAEEPASVSHVYFRGFSMEDLQSKRIDVKVYLRQGILRRPELVSEWTISLGSLQPDITGED